MLPIHSVPDDLADGPPMIIGGKRVGGSINNHTRNESSAISTISPSEYLGRMFKYTQMDFDYTFAQMVYLCFAPHKVYQLTQYRKRTKGQWARDDPAFIVIQAIFLSAAGWAYGICFGESGWAQVRTFLYFIVGHFLILGTVVSGICIIVCDKYLRKQTSVHGVVQQMEWLYSFDVHCNAFFPFFLMTYVVQYFALPLLYDPTSIVAIVFANCLHTFAVAYYCYVVSLGYNTLPFIERAEVFMLPAVLFGISAIIMCIIKTNLTVVFVEWTTGVL